MTEIPPLPRLQTNSTTTLVDFPLPSSCLQVDLKRSSNITVHEGRTSFFTKAEDSSNPRNWSPNRRWTLTFLVSTLMVSSTIASSAPSGITLRTQIYFDCSPILVAAIISIFVGGYIFGPLIAGPLSENIGRRKTIIIGFTIFSGFNLGCCLSTKIWTLLICRFFAGVAASTPLVVAGAVIAEMWNPGGRNLPMGVFALAPFLGPVIGPIISGYLNEHYSFRSVYWWILGLSTFCLVAIILFLPETYPKVIQKGFKQTDGEEIKQSWGKEVARPLKMLITEPIVVLASLHVAFVYGILYLLFIEYTIVYTTVRQLSTLTTGLLFLPLFFGGLVAILLAPTRWETPEMRLRGMFIGAPLFTASIFWFGFTATNLKLHWAVSAASGFVFGAGYIAVLQGFGTYLAEVYSGYAASALAANMIIRSVLACSFPLIGRQMIEYLGVPRSSTIFGIISVMFIPLPFIVFRYGKTLRGRSGYSPEVVEKEIGCFVFDVNS